MIVKLAGTLFESVGWKGFALYDLSEQTSNDSGDIREERVF
jgi:hypothetical protein